MPLGLGKLIDSTLTASRRLCHPTRVWHSTPIYHPLQDISVKMKALTVVLEEKEAIRHAYWPLHTLVGR